MSLGPQKPPICDDAQLRLVENAVKKLGEDWDITKRQIAAAVWYLIKKEEFDTNT